MTKVPFRSLAGGLLGLYLVVACGAPTIVAQNVDKAEESDEDGSRERVFLPPDRATRELLDRAEQLLAQRRFGEAVQALSSVLNAPEDFFFRPGERGRAAQRGQTFRSLKSEARRLIGALPEAGRRSYELQYGAVARRKVEEAVSRGDMDLLADVTRRYFHTEAGYDAMIILGHYHMDQGRPLAAALCFDQVARTTAAESHQPGLGLVLAVCWQRSGQTEKATTTLAALRRKYPDARWTIAGKDEPVFAGAESATKLLGRADVPVRSARTSGHTEWTMYGGDPARTSRSEGSRPMLLRPCWRQRVTFEAAAEQSLAARARQFFDQSQPALPALRPLAVGDIVLMRAPGRLAAVDFSTGKLAWQVDTPDAAAGQESVDPDDDRRQPSPLQGLIAANRLADRVWRDATYGTLSSDGELVYDLEDAGITTARGQRVTIDAFGNRRNEWNSDASVNVLAAYEVKQSQGKRRWSVGGPNGAEPRLENAFFLGAPLPLQGRLYAIVETGGEVRLVVLSAETGKLQWSQQLAVLDEEVSYDPWRRRSGASPSFADGVLVCPTTLGAVVAIDLTTRSLLWGYQYPRDASLSISRESFAPWGARSSRLEMVSTPPRAWKDSHAVIVEGKVLITPPESTQLHCLNLTDGKVNWKLDRGENLYVACVHRGRAIVVGRTGLSAISLKDGPPEEPAAALRNDGKGLIAALKTAAQRELRAAADKLPTTVELPEGAMPSGHGFATATGYLLPLVTPAGGEVDLIDLDQMRIVERVPSRDGSVPGNLVAYRGHVISQGSDWLQDYYQLDAVKKQVATALEIHGDDPAALALKGELLIAEQRFAEAVPLLRRAYERYSMQLAGPETAANRSARREATAQRMATRELLVDGLLETLKSDFHGRRSITEEITRLAELPEERMRLLRIVAVGLENSGELGGALKAYLDLVDEVDESEQLVSLDAVHSARLDRWLAARLSALVPRLPESLQAQFQSRVEGHFRRALRTSDLESHAALFDGQPTAATAKLRLAARLDGPEHLLRRILLLEEASRTGQLTERREAVARLALLLAEAKRPLEAGVYYRRLLAEWPGDVCLDGRTGRQIAASLPPEVRTRSAGSPAAWPTGAVKVTQGESSSRYPNASASSYFELATSGRPTADPVRVFVDPQNQTVSGLDGLGRLRWRWPLGRNEEGEPHMLNRGLCAGRIDGHLLVVSVGYQIMALNTLRPSDGSRSDGIGALWVDDAAAPSLGGAGSGDLKKIERVVLRDRGGAQSGASEAARPWEDDHPDQRGYGTTLARLGPITPGGIAYMRNRELVSVDPLTGKKIWMRRDVPAGSELFGDGELLVVVPPNAVEALIVRALDGTLLGRRSVPESQQRWTNVGRNILALRKTDRPGDPQHLVLWDPWRGAEVWNRPLSRGTKIAQVDERTAACLDRAGRLALLDLASGEPVFEQQLDPEPRLSGLWAIPSRDTLLIVANQPTRRGMRDQVAEPVQENGGPMITGRIYAFNRQSGKPLWPVPASIERFALLLEQPRDVPVAVFARRVTERGGDSERTAFLLLDKRTGALAAPTSEFPRRINNFEIIGDDLKKTVTLMLRTTASSVTLTFTDEPAPPEPPIQIEAQRYVESRRMNDALGGVLKAVGRAAEQLQGLPVDDEEQEKELFGE